MVSVVSGIIIDTFGENREELDEKMNDREKICFICGKNNEIIEKALANNKNF